MISITKSSVARLASASVIVATMAVASVPAAAMAASPVFQNPSFENGTFTQLQPPYDFARLSAGSTDLTGWTIKGGGVDWIGSYWQGAAGSTRSVDLDGSEAAGPGGVSQTFDTVVSGTYIVTFSMSGNPDAGPTIKGMTVDAADTSQSYSYDTSAITSRDDMHWTSQTFTFTAKSTSTTLSFTSTTAGGYGPALDNVSITQTLGTGASCKNNGWKTMVDSNNVSFRNQGDCVSFYATGEKNLAN